MYEDDPQEKVFDVLGEAVFGDHPLGRAIIGRAPVIADTPGAGDRALPRRALSAGEHRDRRRRRGRPRRSSSSSPPGIADCRSRDGRSPRRSPRPAAAAPACRFERKDTEQFHVCLGGPALAPRRSPLRAARARHDLRRDLVIAAVPGDPRAPRAGLLGLLVHERLPGRRPGRAVCGHARRQHRRGAARSSAPSSHAARGAGDGRGARAGQGEPEGPRAAGARVDRRADEPSRLGDARRSAAALARRGRSTDRRRHASTTWPELVDELWAPERLSAAGIGPDEERFDEALAAVGPALVASS